MKTPLRDLLRKCHEHNLSLYVDKGDLRIVGERRYREPLMPALQEWIKELLLLFTLYPRKEIPESFFTSPCSRCKRYGDVRKTEPIVDEQGQVTREPLWVCACYYDVKYGLNPVYWRKPIQEELTHAS